MERTRDSEISKTEYEVFLSFRGPDTRQSFTDVLYDYLKDGGIRVFRDNDELDVGDEIGLILDAIKNSMICVPIFSKSFASSSWCLREVAKMVELDKDIIPIFYDVSPDDVKLETTLYVDRLRAHEADHGKDKVDQWKEALQKVARIKGRALNEKGFVEFSKKFRAEILFKLGVKQKYTINHLVELADEIEEARKLLDIESADDVRFLGLYGMGGIGKTTLAKILFNRISCNFDACSFLANVREEHSRKGLKHLQKKLLQDLNPKGSDNSNTADWVDRMNTSLWMKRVLIVLDDVDERSHVTELVGDSISFGLGSRIIITTRDERVLLMNVGSSDEGSANLSNRVIRAMQIKGMNEEEALLLFSRHAFGRDSPPEDYMSLSKDVVSISGRLPLALEVIGSLLCDMSLEAWEDKIKLLKKIPEEHVQEKLMVSYEALEDDAKEIFLDIACFFIDEEKSNPIYMWEACGWGPNWTVPVLRSKSLIRITEDGKFWMHDQLRDLGREIIRIQGYNTPSSREGSRIQTYEDLSYVLDITKEKQVVGLRLDGSGDTPTDFSTYGSLRFLQVSAIPIGNFEKLPKNLRWLSVRLDYPNLTTAIRSKFPTAIRSRNSSSSNLMKLAILDLSYSINITDYWKGWIIIQELQSLKVLNLSYCMKLTRTPNFSKMVALEKLILSWCTGLVKIDSSIGKLRKLKYLNLEHCRSLKELPEEVGKLEDVEKIIMTKTVRVSKLPDSIGELKNMERLSLRGCKKLKKLPESIGDLRSLVHLDIYSDELKKLPESIGRLAKLEHLDLSYCSRINKLPDSIGDLTSLVSLDLSWCSLIHELPSSITRLVKLQRLSLSRCEKIVKLPDDFSNLESLVELDLSDSGVVALPDSIGDLASLQVMNLRGAPVTTLPETIAQFSLLRKLDLSKCNYIERLPELPTGLTDLKIMVDPRRQAPDLSKLIRLTELTLGGVIGEHLEFSTLTQLKSLTLGCQYLKCVPSQFPSSLQYLELQRVTSETKLPCLSNLNNLSQLVFYRCWMEGGLVHSLGVDRLESLTRLKVDMMFDKIPDLSQLKCLQVLVLEMCLNLVEIPVLVTLASLKELYIYNCLSLERLGNIKNLTRLTRIVINDCNLLVEIPSLGTLTSLKELCISNCDSIKRLENIKNLTMLTVIEIEHCKNFRRIEGLAELHVSYVRIEECKCKDTFIIR